MTRINSAISVCSLTDEHLLAEHREIKRLPACFEKAKSCGSLSKIPQSFCLGKGHVLFFMDKAKFTLDRYKAIYTECVRRGFNVENYSKNWNIIVDFKYWNDYYPTEEERVLLVERITERITDSGKACFHYEGKTISKDEAILSLSKK